ncbi:uncharacterized protein LOC142225299 [Haematobia irritans]|uniref:uncharacterized protein LOC142225299 n=1 Tax=Haematobia irritans TaxID=7368 RepID=UPI003F4FCB8F
MGFIEDLYTIINASTHSIFEWREKSVSRKLITPKYGKCVGADIQTITKGIHFLAYQFYSMELEIMSRNIERTMSHLFELDKCVSSCYTLFLGKLKDIINLHIPRLKHCNHKLPWYTNGLKKLKNLRNKFHKIHKSTNSAESKRLHEHYSREFLFLNKFLYKQYISDYEGKIKSNPKSFWQFIKCKKGHSDFPSSMHMDEVFADSSQSQANLFAKYFSSNFQKFDLNELDSRILENVSSVLDMGLIQFSLDDVWNSLLNLNDSVRSDMDGLSSLFLKKCASSISGPLQYIFNLSLRNGLFLDNWKTASVTPVFKSGLKGDIRNFRPISKLCNISKILEHLVYERIVSTVRHHISDVQHGLEKGNQVDTIYLDFCKAFDKVVHNILLAKLYKMGFHSSLPQWLRSYLNMRKCFVYVDASISEPYIYVYQYIVCESMIILQFLLIEQTMDLRNQF